MKNALRTGLAAIAILGFGPRAIAQQPPSRAVERILTSARLAYGAQNWTRSTVLAETGTDHSSGLNGRWQSVQDMPTGRMRVTENFGVFQTADAWDGLHHWRQDHSGGVHDLNSSFAQSRSTTEEWVARLAFLRPDAGGARILSLGTQRADGQAFQTLRADPPGGQSVELWFDPKTDLLARTQWIMPTTLLTIRYEDYRKVNGTMVPFTIITQEEDSHPDTLNVDHAEFRTRRDDDFVPLQTPDDSTVAGGVTTVPLHKEGFVVFEAKLNGKGPYSFILDTGGHDILSVEAAKTLGLKPVGAGEGGGSGAGKVSVQYTRVDRVRHRRSYPPQSSIRRISFVLRYRRTRLRAALGWNHGA